MTPLHAPDPMGEASHDAAMLAYRLDARLLIAASGSASRQDRADALRKALEQWSYLCAAMTELEAAAPTVAAQARDRADRVRDFREATHNPAEQIGARG